MTDPHGGHRSAGLLRRRDGNDSARVGMVELFFDLVFVFAVTQLSHSLLGNLTIRGMLEIGLLLVAVWWVWIYTSWVTNWLDPERIPVRVCLFILLAAGLLMSVAIPEAFGERGALFASAYVFMQVGRSLFFLWAVHGHSPVLSRNFQRIVVWFSLSGACWLAGAYGSDVSRYAWWLLALGIELIGPFAYYWVPGLGRSTTADWNIEGGHLSERCALFVIIALGESLLVSGATFGDLPWTPGTWAALANAVFGAVLMWWIYFDTGAERATERIRHSHDPGRQGRLTYTYVHVLIVAGIIIVAVGDELVLAHPDHGSNAAMIAILAGPACYLLGTAVFKWVTNDRKLPPLSHLVGLTLFAMLAWPTAAHRFSPLALSSACTVTLAVVAVWEALALRDRKERLAIDSA